MSPKDQGALLPRTPLIWPHPKGYLQNQIGGGLGKQNSQESHDIEMAERFHNIGFPFKLATG